MNSLFNNPKYADVAVDIVKASDPDTPLITFYLQTDLLKAESEKFNAAFSLEWSSTLLFINHPSFERNSMTQTPQILNYKLIAVDSVVEENIPRVYEEVFQSIYQSRFSSETDNYTLDDWLVLLSVFEEMLCANGINRTATIIIEKVLYGDKQAIQKLIEYNNHFPNPLIASHIKRLALVNGFTIEHFKVMKTLSLLESAFKSCQIKGFPDFMEVKEILISRFPASEFDIKKDQTDLFKFMCRLHGSEELLWESAELQHLVNLAENTEYRVTEAEPRIPLMTAITSMFCECLSNMSSLASSDELYIKSLKKLKMIPNLKLYKAQFVYGNTNYVQNPSHSIYIDMLDNAILSNLQDINQTDPENFYNFIVAFDNIICIKNSPILKLPKSMAYIDSLILSENDTLNTMDK